MGGTAGDGSIRIEGALAEAAEGLFGYHAAEGVFVKSLDLLDFMGGAETVEEMKEGEGGLDGGKVCHCGHVLGFLDGTGCQHAEAGLAAGHDVLVVSEDGEGVAGQCAGAHVEYGGQHFTGNLVHIGDHEEKSLGCGER